MLDTEKDEEAYCKLHRNIFSRNKLSDSASQVYCQYAKHTIHIYLHIGLCKLFKIKIRKNHRERGWLVAFQTSSN